MSAEHNETTMPDLEQLRKLWNLAVSDDSQSGATGVESRYPNVGSLEAVLDARLPEEVFNGGQPAFRPMLAQYTLRQILASSVTPKDFWRHLKRYYKKRASHPGSADENSPAAVIYYAAIAANIVHHGDKISRHSWGKLERSFRHLAGHFEFDQELARLFQQASINCRKEGS